MDLPAIGYDNYLTHSGVTPTGDGTNPEYAYNWRTDDAWTTGAASGYIEADMTTSHSPDYFAVVGHTLGTRSATIKLQYWTGAAYADIPEATATPSDDTAIMVVFTPVAATKFKLVVTTDGTAVTIAVASFGEVTTLERGLRGGYAPPPLARRRIGCARQPLRCRSASSLGQRRRRKSGGPDSAANGPRHLAPCD